MSQLSFTCLFQHFICPDVQNVQIVQYWTLQCPMDIFWTFRCPFAAGLRVEFLTEEFQLKFNQKSLLN